MILQDAEMEAEKRWIEVAVKAGKIKLEKRKGSLVAIPVNGDKVNYYYYGCAVSVTLAF